LDYRGFRKKGALGNARRYEHLTRPRIYKKQVIIDESIIEKYKILPTPKILMRIRYLRDIVNADSKSKQNLRYAQWLTLPDTIKYLNSLKRYRDKRNSYLVERKIHDKARRWHRLIRDINLNQN
jgi:hypothetical protein